MIYLAAGIKNVDEEPRVYKLLNGSDVTVSDKEMDDVIETFEMFEDWHSWALENINGFGVSDE